MDNQSFVRGVAKAGSIILGIFKVFSVIGAVCVLIAILTLSLLPKNFVTVDLVTQTQIKVDLRSVLGDGWQELDWEKIVSPAEQAGGKFVETKDGLQSTNTIPSTTVENKTLALSLIPDFVECIILFAFFRFLGKVCFQVQNSPTPFTLPAAQNLKYTAFSLLALALLPGLCSGIVALLTGTDEMSSTGFELGTVLWGFFLWALSQIFEYALSILPPSAQTFDPAGGQNTTRQNGEDQNNAF